MKASNPRYGRYAGLAGAVILALAAIYLLFLRPAVLSGIPPGNRVAPFAVPLVLGSLQGDADIATRADQGGAGLVPACAERGAQILNICQLYEQGPVVLALFLDAGGCTTILNELQQLAPSFPSVRFAAVAIEGDRAALRRLLRSQRLTLPVGVDSDGAAGSLYKVAQLPAGQLRVSRRRRTEPGAVEHADAGDAARTRASARGRLTGARAGRAGALSETAGSRPEQRQSVRGWRERELQEELPGLSLFVTEALRTRKQALTGDSPAEVRTRLHELSNRFRGARAVGIRREPVPAAYRVFFRQIGLDPDVVRTPIEAAMMERMLRGGFASAGLLEDVLLIALLDTGVPGVGARCALARRRARYQGVRRGRAAGAFARRAGCCPRAASSSPTPRRRSRSCSASSRRGTSQEPRRDARDAVRGAGRRGAVAVRRGGAVDLPARTLETYGRIVLPGRRRA